MYTASVVRAIEKLAVAGERSGFTIEQMIDLLNEGLTVENLVELILLRLNAQTAVSVPLSAAHVMGRKRAAVMCS